MPSLSLNSPSNPSLFFFWNNLPAAPKGKAAGKKAAPAKKDAPVKKAKKDKTGPKKNMSAYMFFINVSVLAWSLVVSARILLVKLWLTFSCPAPPNPHPPHFASRHQSFRNW